MQIKSIMELMSLLQQMSIVAILDGVVILSTYTADTGYLIQIQHNQDFVSVYKHCGSLLKKQGDRVKAGEVIALVGDTGDLGTGPHLHFELWYKGQAVNPEYYIAFKLCIKKQRKTDCDIRSTGSIGTQALAVIDEHSDRCRLTY